MVRARLIHGSKSLLLPYCHPSKLWLTEILCLSRLLGEGRMVPSSGANLILFWERLGRVDLILGVARLGAWLTFVSFRSGSPPCH